MLPLILLLAAADDAGALIATARARIAIERRCGRADTTDVTVCGLRDADRFRVPFDGDDPGDPRHESVAAERERLLHRTTPIQDLSPFLVGGGMVGVKASTGFGGPGAGGVHAEGLRPLAP